MLRTILRRPAPPREVVPAGDEAFHALKKKANPKKFPSEVIKGCESAASFFCAAFEGYNDVVHIHRRGLKELVLVDLDNEKLEAMAKIYRGDEVSLRSGDAFEIAREWRLEGRKFDIVITDPWSNIMQRTAIADLPLFAGLARKYYLTGLTGADFAALGIKPDVEEFNAWLAAHGRGAYRIDRLIQRNPDYLGGVYWLVFPVEGVPEQPLEEPAESVSHETASASALPAYAATGEDAFEQLRAQADPKIFPTDIVNGSESALSFFCAAFLGVNDAVHLHKKGLKELLLVDVNEEKLNAMREIYLGDEVGFEHGDAFRVARALRHRGRKFDIVITDPWSNIMQRTSVTDLPLFAALANKCYLSGLTGVDFEEMGIKPDVRALNKYLAKNGRGDYRVDRLILRNPGHQGGVYWVIFKIAN